MRRSRSLQHAKRRLVITTLFAMGLCVVIVALVVGKEVVFDLATVSESGLSYRPSRQQPAVEVESAQLVELEPTYYHEYANQRSAVADAFPTPINPELVTATNTEVGNAVVVEWEYPNTLQADGFTIWRSTVAGTDGEEVGKVAFEAAEFVDYTVEEGETYYYGVGAVREVSGEEYTSTIEKATKVKVNDKTAPPAPEQITVARAADDISALVVSWQIPTANDIDEFNIYRSTQYGEIGQLLGTQPATIRSIQDRTVKPGVEYFYTVTAVDEAGNESVKRLPFTVPGNPTPFAVAPISETDVENLNDQQPDGN